MLKLTNEEFLSRAKKILGEKYDYSMVDYKDMYHKIHLICSEHGDFYIRPHNIMYGQGCPICGTKKAQMKNRMKQEEFVERANKVHSGKYDYSKSIYENTDTKVCIICPEHGEFWQSPHHHLNGVGCPKCGRNDITEQKIFEEVISKYPDAIHQYRPDFLYNNGKPLSLDIFIPSKKIAIEYQGRQHFVPVSRYGGKEELIKTQDRDKRKLLLCNNNGVTLLYISFEKEAPNKYIGDIYNNTKDLFVAIENS